MLASHSQEEHIWTLSFSDETPSQLFESQHRKPEKKHEKMFLKKHNKTCRYNAEFP